MSVRAQLLALQWAQLKHDEAYHKDIVVMPLAQRMKHMALHNAKYTAYFLEAAQKQDNKHRQRVLIDAFIIVLVVANILNQDLGTEVESGETAPSLQALGGTLANSLPHEPNDPFWIVHQYIQHNGRLAKLCESWDHLEAVPYREGMKDSNLALLRAVLAEAAAHGIDVEDSYRIRLRAVEARSIFDSYFRESASGEA